MTRFQGSKEAMPTHHRNRWIAAGFALLVFLGVYLYRTNAPAMPDTLLRSAFDKADTITSYSQDDRTEALVGDKKLVIRGMYLVERLKASYASLSTTTVYQVGAKTGESFTLANIALGNDVYTRMQLGGTAPETSIPASKSWKHFKSNAIPDDYIGIAVPGPLLDNLQLFGEHGTYLTLEKRLGDELVGETSCVRYRFRLSGVVPPSPGGTLEALIGHIGSGRVDAWVAPDGTLRQIAITSPSYRATTTLSRFGEDLGITVPGR